MTPFNTSSTPLTLTHLGDRCVPSGIPDSIDTAYALTAIPEEGSGTLQIIDVAGKRLRQGLRTNYQGAPVTLSIEKSDWIPGSLYTY